MERHGRREVLELHLGQAQIACVPERHPSDALGTCAFDARTLVIARFPLGSLLLGPHARQCFIVGLYADAELSGVPNGTGALRPDRTAATDGPGELDRDDGGASAVMGRRPRHTALSLRADRLAPLPLEVERGNRIAGFLTRLPTIVGAHRPDYRHPALSLTGEDPVGVGVARIDKVLRRQHIALEQRLRGWPASW